MKKYTFIFTILLSLLVIPQTTSALTPLPLEPIEPTTVEIKPALSPIETGIKLPEVDPDIVFDPSLIPDDTITIDPDILDNFKPLPLDPIVIPPGLLKGPDISDISISSDGLLLQVNWKTNKIATSKVSYGRTAAYDKALEDLNLTTEHSMVFPAGTGTWHIQISSQDSLKRESSSPDISAIITAAQTSDGSAGEEAMPADENASDDEVVNTNATAEAAILEDDKTLGDSAQNMPADNKTNATDEPEGFSNMELILGGIALLLAGTLLGVLLNKKSKSEGKKE